MNPARVALVCLASTATTTGCITSRQPLTTPLALTQGGTAVPANGAGGLVEYGGGFRGQELERTEALAVGFTAGVEDRVSLSVIHFEDAEQLGGGSIVRAKVRAGPLFGRASSTGVAVSFSTGSITIIGSGRADSLQHDRVRALDIAVPSEFVLARSSTGGEYATIYAGPRIVLDRYDDLLDRLEDLDATLWGVVSGLHARVKFVHLFAEASLMHSPARTLAGTRLEGGWSVVPAVGVSLFFGQSHEFGRDRQD